MTLARTQRQPNISDIARLHPQAAESAFGVNLPLEEPPGLLSAHPERKTRDRLAVVLRAVDRHQALMLKMAGQIQGKSGYLWAIIGRSFLVKWLNLDWCAVERLNL